MKFLFSVLMLVMSFSVLAAEKGSGSGICKTDRDTYCSDKTPGNWTIHDCLYSNLSSLSTDCQTVVSNMSSLKAACASFATCSSSTGPKELTKCLREAAKAGTLTDETCKAKFESLKPTTTTAVTLQ